MGHPVFTGCMTFAPLAKIKELGTPGSGVFITPVSRRVALTSFSPYVGSLSVCLHLILVSAVCLQFLFTFQIMSFLTVPQVVTLLDDRDPPPKIKKAFLKGLYQANKDLSAWQCVPRWPAESQVLPQTIKHIR